MMFCVLFFLEKLKNAFCPFCAESEFRYARWKKAVEKSMNWETTQPVINGNGRYSFLNQDESQKTIHER